MKTFSISELEHITGIKAHTIRVWERRYNVFSPSRTAGKSRVYNTDDLFKALQISLLSKGGFRISHLARLSPEKLHLLAEGMRGDGERQQKAVNNLLVFMHALDTEKFEALIDECYALWSADAVFHEVIYPFLQKTGLFWRGNRLTEEHLVVTIIRSKIIAGIERLRPREKDEKTIVLFLPEKGQLDLLLLYTHYMVKRKGCSVIYMGNDIANSNLKTIIEIKKPDVLFTYLLPKSKMNIPELAGFLPPGSQLIIAGDPDRKPIDPMQKNVLFLEYRKALSILCDE